MPCTLISWVQLVHLVQMGQKTSLLIFSTFSFACVDDKSTDDGWNVPPVVEIGVPVDIDGDGAADDGGVEGVVILNGKTPHAVLLELFTDAGAGTLLKR